VNKIALITGASRGIGAATAKLLSNKGYSVCVNFIKNEIAANQVVLDIQNSGGTAIAVQADVSIEGDVNRLFSTIDNELGSVTHLVNNAGILMPQSNLLDLSAERINKILTTNVTSYFLCCREAVKRMLLTNTHGAIVNVSSGAAQTGSPNEYIDYAASKGAIDTLTKGLAMEIAEHQIRVNGVRPGLIYTDMHADGGEPERVNRLKANLPLKRGGSVDEVAQAIYWLLSDEASFTTGTMLNVSGGR
jgi:NAD(P)-dependent dehydrogenase (short-subunit alcohol dehydrogenase family)